MEDNIQTLFNGRIEFVPVKFHREWMGHPKGSKITLDRRQANILENRGTVEIMLDKKESPKRKIRKQINAPAKDKMLKDPEKSK